MARQTLDISGLTADLRYALRSWRRRPGLSVTLVCTLALGLGLGAAILSFADGYLFRPLPFPSPEQLYRVRDPHAPIALLAAEADALRHSDLSAFGFVLTVPIVAGAQAGTGSVAGKIGDTSGAPLPGVTVTANLDGRTQSVTTNIRGEYRLDGLPPGVYRLWASSTGFVTSTADRIDVEARRVTEWNVPMIAARRDAEQDLVVAMRRYVERFTGLQAVDCGQQRLQPRLFVPIDVETMRRSLACGTDAMQRGQPFWTFWQQPGIDSWWAVGLLGTADRAVYRFDYDSAPCGGTGCGDRFSVEPCPAPRIATDRTNAVLRCRPLP